MGTSPEGPSDTDLLNLKAAFAEVYDRHSVKVLAWANARVGEHAANLTADVFAPGQLRFERSKPWAVAVF